MLDRDSIVGEMRSDRLVLASSLIDQSLMSDDYIWSKVIAAQADAARRLRVLFGPTYVFAGDPTQQEIDAVGDNPWIVEPPYDYEPDMWMADKWGMIILRMRPVMSVGSMVFHYPVPITSTFTVPSDWIRLDRKYGQVQMVPTGMATGTNIALYLLQTIGGGRQIPHMLHIRYRAGMNNPEADYPDLIDLIKKMAVVRMIQDSFVPQSGSISADGLSQSSSFDIGKYQEQIEHSFRVLYDSIHGVQFCVA